MTHKKEYVVDGNKISKYNKDYYLKHRDKLKARANKRLELNPNLNKDYYKKHKKGG